MVERERKGRAGREWWSGSGRVEREGNGGTGAEG